MDRYPGPYLYCIKYGTLLREPRRALHSRIASVLESQFPDGGTKTIRLRPQTGAIGWWERRAREICEKVARI